MTASFKYPTVVLEHSEFVSGISCTSVGIDIAINSTNAFQVVQDSWANLANLVIISYSDACSASSNDTRTFWLASSSSFTTAAVGGTAVLVAQEILTEQGLKNADLVWGRSHLYGFLQ